MNVLLVEPAFPVPIKSKNHAKFLPLPLLKHATYHKAKGDSVVLVRGNKLINFKPDTIKITSLFTYWSSYVFESIRFYKREYPSAEIELGGVFASLMPKYIKNNFNDIKIFAGPSRKVDKYFPDYSLIPNLDYQIIHASRGCFRRCPFCGTYKIEKEISFKRWKDIKKEIIKNKVIFYDNNFLMNPYRYEILEGIAKHRVNDKVIHCECQSGFDPKLIDKEIACLLKKARFSSIRISWDFGMEQKKIVRNALECLNNADFNYKNISIFMIYNWDIPYKIMEKKRKICKLWNVQITDCRYRPLNQLYDNYNPRAKFQTSEDYYIHPFWIDKQIRAFRKKVREQNICIRFGFQNIQHYKDWLIKKDRSRSLVNNGFNLREKQLTLATGFC